MPKRARVSSLLVQALEGVDITATILQFLDVTSLRNLEEVVGPSSLSAAYRALPYHLGELGSGYDLRNVFMWVQARGIACASLGISSWTGIDHLCLASQCMPSVVELSISADCLNTDEKLQMLPQLFPNLQRLKLRQIYSQPMFKRLLIGGLLPSLRSFSSCELGDTHLAGVVEAFPNLHEILIPNSTITSLLPLLLCPQLEVINLWSCRKVAINQEAAQLAAGLPHLQQMNLGWTKLDDTGLASLLSKAADTATSVTVINIQDCRLVTDAFRDSLRDTHPGLLVYDDADDEVPEKPNDWSKRYHLFSTGKKKLFGLDLDGPGDAQMCDRCYKNTRPHEWNTVVTNYCSRCNETLCEHCCKHRDMKYCGLCDEQTCKSCYDEDAWLGYCEMCDHSICDKHEELKLDRCRRCHYAVCTTCIEQPTSSILVDAACRAGHDLDGEDEGPDMASFLSNLITLSQMEGMTPAIVRGIIGIHDEDD